MTTSGADLRDLQRAIRALQLPLEPASETRAASVAQDVLLAHRIARDEHANAVASDLRSWELTGKPTSLLKKLVGELLLQCGGMPGEALASGFFKVHRRITDGGDLDFASARRLLSNARLVAHLMEHERMSCAQVARVLSAHRRGAPYNWEQVATLARCLNVPMPTLSPEQVQSVIETDRAEQVARFADSTAEVELQLIADAAKTLGLPEDAQATFMHLIDPRFDPAVTILLHFALTVCEFYDHPPSVLYEFRPRGSAFKALQQQNLQYVAQGSAALNIAKGAFALDAGWAWVRKGTRRSNSLTLVRLLEGMEEMHYAARRELAAWLRQLIVRLYERQRVESVSLPYVSTEAAALALLRCLIGKPTRSYGTIEQRIVDTLSAILHPNDEWSSRGRKDSVFASNLSRKKMGDCEYTCRMQPTIVAYEAHAGALHHSYVIDHYQSLLRVIEVRREDLESQNSADDWGIEVVFVTHESDGSDLHQITDTVDYAIKLNTLSYNSLLDDALARLDTRMDGAQYLVSVVNDGLIGPLNEAWIPQAIRDRVFELWGIGLDDVEDHDLAADVLERIRMGREQVHSAEAVRKDLGLED